MDVLTGIADRHEFSAWLDERGNAEQVSLALIDVDDMRELNERDGYEQVDALLVRLGALIRDSCGGQDIVARLGGEEFVLGLDGEGVDEAIHEVEEIRRRFRELSGGVTLSAGICDSATLRSGWRDSSLFIQAADEALREAMQQRPEGLVVYRPRS